MVDQSRDADIVESTDYVAPVEVHDRDAPICQAPDEAQELVEKIWVRQECRLWNVWGPNEIGLYAVRRHAGNELLQAVPL